MARPRFCPGLVRKCPTPSLLPSGRRQRIARPPPQGSHRTPNYACIPAANPSLQGRNVGLGAAARREALLEGPRRRLGPPGLLLGLHQPSLVQSVHHMACGTQCARESVYELVTALRHGVREGLEPALHCHGTQVPCLTRWRTQPAPAYSSAQDAQPQPPTTTYSKQLASSSRRLPTHPPTHPPTKGSTRGCQGKRR